MEIHNKIKNFFKSKCVGKPKNLKVKTAITPDVSPGGLTLTDLKLGS